MSANAPTRLSGTPRTSYLTMMSHRRELSWDTYEASCRQLRYFEVSVAQTNTNDPSSGPPERSGAPDQVQKGPLWKLWDPLGPSTAGPPGMMHPPRKILATSIFTPYPIIIAGITHIAGR